MADSKRLTILKRLTAYLSAQVKPANGYTYDLTGKVYRGRTVFDDKNDPMPMVSILEQVRQDVIGETSGRTKTYDIALPLQIQGWAKSPDPDNPTDGAHQLLADLKKALNKLIDADNEHNPDYLLGKSVRSATIASGLVAQAPDDAFPGCYLLVELQYIERADPYSL